MVFADVPVTATTALVVEGTELEKPILMHAGTNASTGQVKI
jgi:hypothetical protein